MLEIHVLSDDRAVESICSLLNSYATDFYLKFTNFSEEIYAYPAIDLPSSLLQKHALTSFLNSKYFLTKDIFSIIITSRLLDDYLVFSIKDKIAVISSWHIISKNNYLEKLRSLIYLAAIAPVLKKENYDIKQIPPAADLFFFLTHLKNLDIETKVHHYRQLISCYEGKAKFASNHIVLITHGIRTRAYWIEESSKLLKERGFDVVTHRYGLLSTLKFFFSQNIEKAAIDFLKKIVQLNRDNPSHKISIMAHSNGTLLIAKALNIAASLEKTIKIHGLLLGGSIVPENFQWKELLESSNINVEKIFNLCGENDFCPLLAKKFLPGKGSSGTFFFNDSCDKVINYRIKNSNHSSILSVAIFDKYWLRFLLDIDWFPSGEPCKPNRLIRALDVLLVYLNYKTTIPFILIFLVLFMF